MANNNNENGQTPMSMVSDMIEGFKENIFGAEGVLTDVNVLGMARPLSQINIAASLREQGGILKGLQTGIRRQTAARKGGNLGTPPPQRQPRRDTGQIPRQPAPRTPPQNSQPDRIIIAL